MRRLFTVITAAALACIATVPAIAGPVIDWDPAYYYESGATPINSIPGTELHVVGIVSAFGPPLNFLNANDPTKDYTFYLHGMLSNGTTVSPFPPYGNFYTTTYGPGVIELYEGTPRDAVSAPGPPNAQVPSTFTNGTLILSGIVNNLYWQSNDFTAFQTGNSEASITWTGGAYFNLMSRDNQPCPSLYTGGTTWRSGLLPAGYLFRHDGKIDLDCPVPAGTGTWGRMKVLYR